MNVRVFCPHCEQLLPAQSPPLASGPCPLCDAPLEATPGSEASQTLTICRWCGHNDLYVQKDFPHWLGLSILIGGVAASFIAYGYYVIWLTWAILLGTAAADGILYYLVGNVTVCYRCLAQHRGFEPNPAHHPWDLGVGEKYRQERLRRRAVKQG
ncbi:MAG TPA: hypothetical protein PKD86_08315 [Gemmatales bacterium]|nr:hypothetical protein [Gemmatales bacterium]HMP59343.1 hypothetical protein [Gemmatales bacterium]